MARWNATSTNADIAGFSDDPLVKKLILRRRIRIGLILLVIGTGLVLGVKPTYNWFRERQINANLEEAKAAARIENWGLARDKARSVLIARPGDFDAFRVWFKALTNANEPRTYMAAIGLFVNPRASATDRSDALRSLCLQAPEAFAFAAFSSMSEEEKKSTPVRVAFAPLLVQRREIQMAEKMMREAPGLETDAPAQLELLRVLCASPSPERVSEARGIFAGLISQKAETQSLDALLMLSGIEGGLAPGAPLPSLPEWISSVPKATTLHQLLALEPGMAASPLNASNVIDRAVQRFIGVDPGVLGTWMVRHGKAEDVVRLLKAPASTSASAYIACLHALLTTRDFKSANDMLRSPPKSVDLVDLELTKAAIAHARGDESAENKAWSDAMVNAAFDQSNNRYLEIARLAEGFGAGDVAEDAWVAAIRLGWGRIPLSMNLSPLLVSLARKNRHEDLLAVCRVLMRFEPANPELINNYNYLAMLMEVIPPPVARAALESLMKSHPEMQDLHSSLAMAFLLENRPQDALRQLTMPGAGKAGVHMIHAVEGSARFMAGEEEEGRKILDAVEWNAMTRCEALAFHRIVAKLKIRNFALTEAVVKQPQVDPDTIPAWKKAIERQEKLRAQDVLPALPPVKVPGAKPAENQDSR